MDDLRRFSWDWAYTIWMLRWCEALSSRGQVSEIMASSSKWARTLGNPDFKSQIVSEWRILDGDPHDFQRRFQLCPPQISIQSAHVGPGQHFWRNPENLAKSDFLKSSFMKSRGVKGHPWWFLMPSQVSISILVHFQDRWSLIISGGFLVFSNVSKCPSVQESKCPSVQVSKCPSVQVSKCPSVQASKCPSVHVRRVLRTPSPPTRGSAPSIWQEVSSSDACSGSNCQILIRIWINTP